MSPLVDINFDDTPLERPIVSIGVHTLKIVDITTKEDKPGVQNVEFVIVEPESDEDGVQCYARFDFQYGPARSLFKQLTRAAGLPATGQGIDTSELIGETVQGVFKENRYKDATGEWIESTQIARYVYDKDED